MAFLFWTLKQTGPCIGLFRLTPRGSSYTSIGCVKTQPSHIKENR